MPKRLLAFILPAVLLAATLTGESAHAGDPALPIALQRKLTRIARQMIAPVDAPLGLSHHGLSYSLRIEVPGFAPFELAEGSANPNGGPSITPATKLRIGSVTKTLTAVGVLKLVDQGRLSLDDTLEQFVPGCPNGKIITIRQLLGMQSGLPEYTDTQAFLADWLKHPLAPYTIEDTIEVVQAGAPQFEPGEASVYTNSNYALLGKIIEIAAGPPWSSWEDWLTAEVVVPAGLTDTVIPKDQDLAIPKGAQGAWWFFAVDDPAAPPYGWHDLSRFSPDRAGAAGNAFSTPSDLSRWLDVLLSGGLLSTKQFAEQMQFHPLDGDDEEYGLGILRGGGLIGHSGETLGSYTEMYLMPSTGIKIIVIAEGGDGTLAPMNYVGELLRVITGQQP